MTKQQIVSPSQRLEPTRPTMDVGEAAALLGVSPWLVLQQIGQGKLPHKRVGRRIVIPRARFMAWLDDIDGPGTVGAGE